MQKAILVFVLVIATVAARPKPAHNVKATKDIRSHVMHRGFEEVCSTITKSDLLLVIDIQKDFHMASANGNGLAVPGSDEAYTETVNRWIMAFQRADAPVIYTQDWHPPDHCSFKCPFPATTQYKTKEITELIKAKGGSLSEEDYRAVEGLIGTCAPTPYGPLVKTTLPADSYPPICKDPTSVKGLAETTLVRWPPHCVQNQDGAAFGKGLYVIPSALKVYKGFEPLLDSYSAWGAVTTIRHHAHDKSDIDTLPMQVAAALGGKTGEKRIFVLGLATDYCVRNTVEDFANALKGKGEIAQTSLANKFRGALPDTTVVFVADGSRGVNPEPLTSNVAEAVKGMKDAEAIILPPLPGKSVEEHMDLLCKPELEPKVKEYMNALKPGSKWNGIVYEIKATEEEV